MTAQDRIIVRDLAKRVAESVGPGSIDLPILLGRVNDGAVRDEIVNLVRDSVVLEFAATPVPEPTAPPEEPVVPAESPEPELAVAAPRTGVEVMPTERRKGEQQYTVRDLRNNRLIHNVTRSSARKLWQYAISEHEERPVNPGQVKWQGNIGVWKAHRRAGKLRYDLCERDSAEGLHTYYGVTEDGIVGIHLGVAGQRRASREVVVNDDLGLAGCRKG